jgi:hypothetical protein
MNEITVQLNLVQWIGDWVFSMLWNIVQCIIYIILMTGNFKEVMNEWNICTLDWVLWTDFWVFCKLRTIV